MSKIIVADNPLNEMSIAQELLPPSLDAVMAKHGSPEFNAALADAECLVGFGDGSMDDAFYKRAPKLKLVQLLSAGYDRIDIEAARRAGVPVCNNGGANSTAVSEHAIMLMLAVSRSLVWQHANVSGGRWRGNNASEIKLYEMYGKTLGIVGLGTIGQEDRETGARVRDAGAILRRDPPERGTRGTDRRALRLAGGAAEDLRHRLVARAVAAGNAPHDQRGTAEDDEAVGVSDQHLPRPGGGRTGADRGVDQRHDRRRRPRRVRSGTAAAEQSIVRACRTSC